VKHGLGLGCGDFRCVTRGGGFIPKWIDQFNSNQTPGPFNSSQTKTRMDPWSGREWNGWDGRGKGMWMVGGWFLVWGWVDAWMYIA